MSEIFGLLVKGRCPGDLPFLTMGVFWFRFALTQVSVYAVSGDLTIKSTNTTNGKKLLSSIAGKARALRNNIASIFAPREVSLAIA